MVTWQNYWTHKGHTFGQCHTRQHSDYFFVNIPKNSSSWTQTLVAHWCLWTPHNYHDCPDLLEKTALVVLRDPVERWISGIAEYIYLYHHNFDVASVNNTMLDWIFDRVAFDDHTEQQSMFIEGLSPKKIIWFWCDQDYSKIFSNFMLSVGELNSTYIIPEPLNTTTSNTKKVANTQFFKSLLENPKYLNKIKQYYAIDYQLIQSAKFLKK
jgi:hypothetical protein